MANFDRPCGFRPYGPVKSSKTMEAGSEIFPGDFVKLSSDGQVDSVSAGDAILGLALSYASGAGKDVLVSYDPEQLYVGQGDGSELDAQTDIGNNCDVLATAGNSTYKQSRQEVDSSSVAASAAQLLILGIEKRTDNALGEFCDVIVKVNEPQMTEAFAGV